MSFFDDLSPLGKILCGAALVAAAPAPFPVFLRTLYQLFCHFSRSSKKDMVSLSLCKGRLF